MTAILGAYVNVIRRHRGQRRAVPALLESRPDDDADADGGCRRRSFPLVGIRWDPE
jgi:hypothetical protein